VKIKLIYDANDAQWPAVAQQIELEGDTITEEEPELELDLRTETLPLQGLQALGYETVSGVPEFYACRWFDGEWHSQEFLGVRVCGVMNENLGWDVPTGFGGFYHRSGFEWKPELASVLKQMKVRNFVSIGLTSDLKVTGLQTGIPFPGLFCVLEGIPCRLGEWLAGPREILESATVSVAVTRSPFPYQGQDKKVLVDGLSMSVLKHLWLPFTRRFRKGWFTESTLVGVASGWAKDWSGANWRALVSCRAVGVLQKQYRTDIGAQVRISFSRIGKMIA